MTVRDALAEGRMTLGDLDTDTPSLDAALLLAAARNTSRERLYMDLAEPLQVTELDRFRENLARRSAGEPVAWILGVKEFWGLPLHVGPGVLCPRPDTETLVEVALEVMDSFGSRNGRLHDCCCGPGTVAVALAVERPDWRISASDISGAALEYAGENNRILAGGRVAFSRCDLMDGIPGPFELIVSNPPYLTPSETAERTALGWREPVIALDGGGTDGLDLVRRLVPAAAGLLVPDGVLALEAHPLQMGEIRRILSANSFQSIEIRCDLAGRDRVISGRRGTM